MKTGLIFSILIAFCIAAYPGKGNHGEKKAGAVKKKVKVVVMGFGKGNLISNYYMDDSLSKFTRIPQDSLHERFSRAIVESFKPNMSNRIEFLTVEDPSLRKQFVSRINYIEKGENRTINFSTAPVGELLEAQHASYLLFISQYEINYILSPYKTYYYIVRYSLVNNKSEKVHEGRVFFENPEIVPLSSLIKRHEKQAQRIASQTEKLLSEK